jgi:ketosteroid isomerase-like protein
MTAQEQANLNIVRSYLAALESGTAEALLPTICVPDIRQIELPPATGT